MGFYMKSQFFACRASNEDIKSWRDRRSANHQINLFIILLMPVHFFLLSFVVFSFSFPCCCCASSSSSQTVK